MLRDLSKPAATDRTHRVGGMARSAALVRAAALRAELEHELGSHEVAVRWARAVETSRTRASRPSPQCWTGCEAFSTRGIGLSSVVY